MPLLLTEADVKAIFTMPMALECVEASFRRLADGTARVAGQVAAQRKGLADRERDRVQCGLRGQLERGGLRAHGAVIGCGRGRLRREVEDHAVQVGAGDPVHHAVVHLGDQRPAALGEPFDDPVLPQWMVAVEPLGHHPRH